MSISLRTILLPVIIAAIGEAAMAQSVYIDFGGSVPSSSYAAAASAPGVWTSASAALPLVGIYGQPIALEVIDSQPICTASICLFPGDAGALLGGWLNSDCFGLRMINIRNLEAGNYRVHVYAYSSLVCSGLIQSPGFSYAMAPVMTSPSTFIWLAPWTGSFATTNHAVQPYAHSGTGDIVITVYGVGNSGIAGLQFEKLSPQPAAFCFGSPGYCPCAPGAIGHGCPVSFDANGSQLTGNGSSSIAADSLTLHATSVSNSFMMIMQGSALANGEIGISFGDGRFCAGGTLIRLAGKVGVNHTMDYPQAGDAAISTLGGVVPGDTRIYQVWFRDTTSFCTPLNFNVTNAVAAVWY